MTDLSSLLARLEAASGPNSELDASLMIAIEPPSGDAFWRWRGIQPKGLQDRAESDLQADFARQRAPAYTSSLDAALALCERALPGWQWRIASTGFAIINPEGARDNSTCIVKMDAPTPALALCIAMVKALTSQLKGK